MRVPPNVVQQHDDALRARPRSRRCASASAPSGCARRAASAASASSGGDDRDAPCPRWRRRADRCRAGRRRRRPPGRPAAAVSSSTTARSVSRASSLAHGADPAAGRIAQPAGRRRGLQQGVDQPAERRGVGADVGVEGEVATGQHHRHAVVGRSCPRRARRRRAARARDRASRPAGTTPTPAVVMYTPSAAPWPTTFVSPVTMRDAGGRGRLGHVGGDRAQLVDREALLDDERRRQPRRPGARRRRGRSRCRARRGGRSTRRGTAAAARRTSRW